MGNRFLCIIGLLAILVHCAWGGAREARAEGVLASEWATAHGDPSMRAATAMPGPVGEGARSRIVPYGDGVSGVSPWLVKTTGGRLYGASLSHLFRYRTDGALRFEGGFALTRIGSISWNLFALASADGPARIVVPQPRGLRNPVHRGHRCAGRVPSLLVFEDRADRPLDCTAKFEFDAGRLAGLCSVPAGYRMAYSGTLNGVLPSGEIAAIVAFRRAARIVSYMVTIDNALSAALACAEIGPGRTTNMFPVEQRAQGRSAAYVANGGALVRLDHDPRTGRLVRRWRVDLGMPQRTGTTPTLVGFGADRFVVLVDGACAVGNVFTGRIRCSGRGASRMLYVRRSETAPAVGAVDLPLGIRTVENSPASTGLRVVIATYGGYRIDPDARGVVALSWDATQGGWRTDWYDPDTQMNGVPTISTSTGVVYGSGADAQRGIAMTGLMLAGPDGGRPAFRAAVGTGDDFLDRGVNTVILSDKRLVYGVADGLVLIEQ